MNILSYHPFTPEQMKRLEALPLASLRIVSPKEDATPFLEKAQVVFSGSALREEVLAQMPQLKWLQVSSAGVNHLPLASLEKREITLTNVRGMHGDCISEYIIAMMFALSRHLPAMLKNQEAKKWERIGQGMLKGKTLGIIGLGGIGLVLAKKAKDLEMQVLGLRNSDKPAAHVDKIYQNKDLHEFLGQSDYVALCCPLTPETTNLIGSEELAAMKESAFLINIARGRVVDEPALIKALDKRIIAGAALDVFWQEPLPEDSPLWNLDNVILTPHIAGDMIDYTERAANIFIDNLEKYLNGQPLHGQVDYKLGY
ncbi:MAG: D-2-hydroxyacid dehydrogenase [Firmicutes bacterium]|jgi:phosphoglycerate dehydrogenase-like enzyme|nr:D-2-hydroxyacid dehydrogenase [Bacillota bacterium]